MSLLPPELLGEIFSYTSSVDPDAPLRVGEVSTLFRRTVRTTPHAWNRLVLSLSVARSDLLQDAASVENVDGRAIRKAELWFAMSRVILVDVSVELSSAQGPSKNGARNHTYIHIPIRGYGYGYYPRHDATTKTHGRGQESQDVQVDFTELLLPHVLRNFNQRIRELDLRTTTVNEAQAFMAAMYPSPTSSISLVADEQVYPLRSLTLHASSDGSGHVPHRHRADLRTPSHSSTISRRGTCSSPTTATGTLILPFIPHVAHLSFYNHLLPPLASENVKNLRVLQVHYPLRFAPMPVGTLLEVLSEARALESVEIEARVTLEDDSHPNLGSASSSAPASNPLAVPQPPTHHLNPAASLSIPPASLPDLYQQLSVSSDLSSSALRPASSHHHSPLFPLPCLTHLYLRINNLPSVLSRLLLPSLRTLIIDDLDGKRPGAAKQTGEVLRGLLVRMEMPFDAVEEKHRDQHVSREGERKKIAAMRGLEVLDMCNIALPASHNYDLSHGRSVSGTDAQVAGAAWAWCFRRMRTLHEMRIKKMDVDTMFELITPRTRTPCTRVGNSAITDGHGRQEGENDKDDIPLPALKKLIAVEQDAYHPHSSAELHRMNAQGHGRGHELVASGSSSPFDRPSPSSLSNSNCRDHHPYPHPHRRPLVKFQLRRPDVEVIYDALLDPMSTAQRTGSSSVGVDFFDLYAGRGS